MRFSAPLPVLATVVDANTPRPRAARRIMKYKRARIKSELAKDYTDDIDVKMAELKEKGLLIEEWTAADVNADLDRIGKAGSPTKVKAIASVVLTASEAKQVEATEAGVTELIHELIADHTLG